ncbi:hypothetical protein [Natrialba aegyptia]|uniref:WD40 repeat domain-containing protein n=1 Tax=Natrialba aegyptia DSM 13077 TaxID=1227491 RepID=M0B929_9EURY|nr:hypothetical protein [Natrialba aegyptia]ELZ07401.1 hypothetical protein C480_05076 [Natrialba aegyptia DSM 13077]
MIDRLDDSLGDAIEWLTEIGPEIDPSANSESDSDFDSNPDSESGSDSESEAADSASNAASRDGAVPRSDGGRETDPSGAQAAADWEEADSPTSRTLHGVVHGADGAYACGEGGILLHRRDDGWQTLIERGPGVADNTLRTIDATADGCRLWFAGDSGALGYYDVADGYLSDYSAPGEKTSTWEGIAVSGPTGEERIRIANGSGEVLDCTVEDGCPAWGDVVEPGGGSTIPGLTAGPDGFYAIDTSGGAYYADANGEWERIGVRNAEVDFYDIWAGDETVFVAGADGVAYRYDPRCENWTPINVGQGALQSIQVDEGSNTAVAVATGGRVYERIESIRWEERDTPTEQSLLDLALARQRSDDEGLATVPVDIAVGAGGTVLERHRDRSDTTD